MMRHFTTVISFLLVLNGLNSQNLNFGGQLNQERKHACVSDEDRQAAMKRLKESPYYKDQPQLKSGKVDAFLHFPLLFTPTTENRGDFGYYAISAHMDLNIFYPDQLRDYTCGERTYDTTDGYNHGGTDFFSWPFPWNKQYDSEVRIIAAADGVIVEKRDGFFDENCEFNPIAQANFIRIRHANGYTTSYLHLKENTVTSKPIGSSVLAGEVIGEVGSSGFSTGPHLHFEVWSDLFNIVDPFYLAAHDDCNVTVDNTLWLDQDPYYNPGINKLMTGYEFPLMNDCIETIDDEQYYRSDFFDFGEKVYCSLFLKDQRPEDNVVVKLLRPDRTTYYENTINCTTTPGACDFFDGVWWVYDFTFQQGTPCGEWAFQVSHGGQTKEHKFILAGQPIVEEIAGNEMSSPFSTEMYSAVDPDPGTSFFWLVFDGTITDGQGTETVTVEWNDQATGSICLIETLSNSCSSPAYCLEVQLDASSSSNPNQDGYIVSPNPFSDIVNVKSPYVIEQVHIYDIYGQLVLSQKGAKENSLDLSLKSLSSGTYFIEINAGNKQIVKKVVKL